MTTIARTTEAAGTSFDPATESRPLTRLAGLDGLRAVAILLVLIHNAGSVNGALNGVGLKLWALVSNAGWVGVQLFFALSGFLITRILLDARGAPNGLRNFYLRRAVRIAPIYYCLLAVVFLVAPRLPFLSPLLSDGTRSSLWYWAYLSNWAGPFGGLPASLPHLWSLAVEEQFYLVWPLLVALSTDRGLWRISLLMVAGAFAVRVALHAVLAPDIAQAAAYTFTITRCDAIALGAMIALAVRHRDVADAIGRRAGTLITVVSIALLALCVASRGLNANGLASELASQPLVGALSALLVFACVDARREAPGWRQRLVDVLSAPWLTSLGKYSYAIYVFHLPIHLLLHPHVQARLSSGSDAARLAAHAGYTLFVLVLSLLLAMLTWRVIEQPFLSLKRYFPMPAAAPRGRRAPDLVGQAQARLEL